MENLINKTLNQNLIQIENEINNLKNNNKFKLYFNDDCVISIISLFTIALIDKIQELQENENLSIEDTKNMVLSISMGEKIKDIIKKYFYNININN
ncbi:MAG TPA: hypothetical protein PLN85_00920 [archaeon]|nr:hypothetical protein [archaeon]